MGCKIFPCIDIHGSQARPCWTAHGFYSRWPLLAPVGLLSSCRVDIVGYGSGIVGLWHHHFHNFLRACEVDGPMGSSASLHVVGLSLYKNTLVS